jgi:diguanylate cyclase (GGDEF)-like protein/PAS domain S-box-containing protein
MADELRRQAEERLSRLAADSPESADIATVVHELRVHQIELEMQNEELRRAQLELEASREKYFDLFDLAPVGYLTLSDKSIVRDANLTATRLLGVERQQLVKKPFTAFIFAPDQDVCYRHQRKLEQTGEPQTCELRLQRAGGEADGEAAPAHFWARLESRPQRAADGNPLSSWVTFTDIDETVAAQEALRESERRFRRAFDESPVGAAVMTLEHRFQRVNPAWARMLGYTADELSRMTFLDITRPEERHDDAEQVGRLLRGEIDELVREKRYLRKDGSEVWGLVSVRVARDDAGEPVSLLPIIVDIDEQKRAEAALAHLNEELVSEAAALEAANATITRIAATDALTGLANRRCFHESLGKAVSLARRHGSPLALVSLDLDSLKQVNDSAGHQAGDEVLTSFAALLGSLCRAEDLPGRLGGDEFSLLLPGIDLSGGRGLAERVLAAVRSCEALKQRGATVSGGVAQWSPGELPDDLLRRADEALYAAKRDGGDAVAGDG